MTSTGKQLLTDAAFYYQLTHSSLLLISLGKHCSWYMNVFYNYFFYSNIKVIPFNCIAHPFCASFFASLARARARARSELDRFSMEAELFREINGRFLLNELGDPTFLFHLFEENTTLHDILKFEELFIIQF